MRTISLVKRLKWFFSGNMNPHALVIGDVDDDNENEFVIGNLNGDMAIFKGQCEDGYPSYICRGLGTITCIAVGDLRNSGKNSIVVVNAEGHAHIFDVRVKSSSSQQQQTQSQEHVSVQDYLKGGRRSSDSASMRAFRSVMTSSSSNASVVNDDSQNRQQQQQQTQPSSAKPIHDLGKPSLTLRVPVNVNKILIADIDNDGLNEIILARTDRILHAFQLVPSDFAATHPTSTTTLNNSSTTFNSNSTNTAFSPNHTSSSSINLTSGLNPHHSQNQPTYSARPTVAATTTNTSFVTTTAADESQSQNSNKKYKLLDKNMWVFDGQISSLCTTTHPEKPDEPLLLVAQPGNTFVIIDQDGNRLNKDFSPQQYDPNDDIHYSMRNSRAPTKNGQNQSTVSNISAEDEDRIRSILLQHQAFASPTVNIPMDTTVHHQPTTAATMGASTSKKHSKTEGKSWSPLSLPTSDHAEGNMEEEGNESNELESGAIATEIVIGKRHLMGDSFLTNKVGMLSMDGTFSIYDLGSKATSHKDLFVTHKLFSLATLNVKYNNNRLNNATDITIMKKPATYLHHHRHGGTQTPLSGGNNNRPSLFHQQQEATRMSPSTTANSSRKVSLVQQQEEGLSRVSSKGSIDLVSNKKSSDFLRDSINALRPEKPEEEATDDSDYESVSWSEGSESENEAGYDLFVACAWNGVTYLIDWSERLDDNDDNNSSDSDNQSLKDDDTTRIKYQLVKFAFEGRVCAFTAGHYCVDNHVNVPCLFYVDFEDQIYVYYDVRITPGPVTGFIDTIDDDVEEALDRIMGLESAIDTLTEACQQEFVEQDDSKNLQIDLGDGWHGIAAVERQDNGLPEHQQQQQVNDQIVAADLANHPDSQDMDFLNLSDFIHECLYGFEDMKDRMEKEMLKFEQNLLTNRIPVSGNTRRLSDLNITLDPLSLNEEVLHADHSDSDSTSELVLPKEDLLNAEENDDYLVSTAAGRPGRHNSLTLTHNTTSTNDDLLSSSSYDNDIHISSWIEGSLMGTSIFNAGEEDGHHSSSNNDSRNRETTEKTPDESSSP